MEQYKTLGTVHGVCGGRVIVLGTRLEPEFIVKYGKQNSIDDFHLTEEQYNECVNYYESNLNIDNELYKEYLDHKEHYKSFEKFILNKYLYMK